MIRFCILSMAVLATTFVAAPTSRQVLQINSNHFDELAARYERPPVNARLDRVWRAIPGLCGWKLDVQGSQAATAKAHDDKTHLKWVSVPPNTRVSDLVPNPIYRATDKEKSACLMFNVSWGEADLPSILATLKHFGVRATFFLDGAWVKKNPDLAKEIVAAGHVVGSHGSGHPDFRKLSDPALKNQILDTNQVIKNTVGVKPTLIAPPAGSFDARAVKAAAADHMYTILWTVDSVDWRRPAATTILSRVMSGMQPGSLILLHPTTPTAQALPLLIRELKTRGYHLKTLEQVVLEQPAVIPPATLSE